MSVALVFGYGFFFEHLTVEIAAKDERAIVFYLIPREKEECVFGFEVADL